MDRAAAPTSEPLLARFGVSHQAEAVWRVLIGDPQADISEIASRCGLDVPMTASCLDALLAAGLLRRHPAPPGYAAIDPALAVETKIVSEERNLAESRRELAALRVLLPELTSEFERSRTAAGPQFGFDLVIGLEEIRRQVYLAGRHTRNEHRSLYHAVPAEGIRHARETDLESLRRGVRQRSIVGIGDLTEPAMYAELAALHEQGEEVRTLPEVPTRLLILDNELAVLPVEPTAMPRRAMFLRDRTLVGVLIYLFDHLWADANPVFATSDPSEPINARHARVLELLAAGTKDEAMARALGIGVRTIKRDIADLKSALGVSSRAEVVAAALRKGWL